MENQKTALVTGACSGIGYELSRALLAKGYRLVMINRSNAKASQTAQSLMHEYPNTSIGSFIADLSVHQDIRKVVTDISREYEAIDVLFNNAGVMVGSKQFSRQGNELHFEVNTVAPFLLTRLLKPLLSKGSNPVVVTSGSSLRKMFRNLRVDSLSNPVVFRKMTGPYAQSKLAISTAFAALAPEYREANIRLVVVDLGPVKTPMSLSDGVPGWARFFRPLFSTPQRAAQKLLHAALDVSRTVPDASGRNAVPSANVQDRLVALLNRITQQTASTVAKPPAAR